MSANAVWQPVVDGADFKFRLQQPKAALNVGQCFVALDDFGRCQLSGISHQRQRAIHQSRLGQGFFANVVGERLALEVYAHDARQISVTHLAIKARPGLDLPPSCASSLPIQAVAWCSSV